MLLNTNTKQWTELDENDAVSMTEEAMFFVADTIVSYASAHYDNPKEYPAMTTKEWTEYVWGTIIFHLNLGCHDEYHKFFAFGKNKICALAKYYVTYDDDIQECVS